MVDKLISACLIVKNEEKNIARCVSGLKKYFYEILVLDTGSCDTTFEICKNLGVKVYRSSLKEWSYAGARNEAMSFCKGDWILMIDADEYIDSRQMEKIRKLDLDQVKYAYKFWRCSFIPNTVINHFYEKILLLAEKMNTEAAKKVALKRHTYMLDLLNEFYQEWEGEF